MILLLFVFPCLSGWAQNNKTKDTTVIFKVYGNCTICKKRIEEAAKNKGVVSASWDIQSKMLTLQYDPGAVSEEKMHQKIANAGHDTEMKKADDEVYNKLPECCLYRKQDGTHSHESDDGSLQNLVMGVIMEEDDKGNLKPLKGANIILNGSNQGITTEENGFFKLAVDHDTSVVTVSYVGFQPKNIDVKPGDHLNIVLNTSKPLEGIKVISTRKSYYISPLSTLRTQVITERELFKAACCNLSESFETNPSVDVSYNDAVTGSKQIQLLGLSGNYTQLTLESLPGPRGLATPWGLNFIPGTWVESIQLPRALVRLLMALKVLPGRSM